MDTLRSILSRSMQYRFYRANPGVGRRIKLLKEGNPELKGVKPEEKSFDDLDIDAFDTKFLKEEYEKKFEKTVKQIEFKKIERQYFERKKEPNFLLWSEKEQIRQLHESQPDRWTFQQLSESFPATPAVIKKIVAARWKMRDVAQIRKHDDRVAASWKAFQEGDLTLPRNQREHLSKFLSRGRLHRPEEPSDSLMGLEEQKSPLAPTKHTEFLDIVKDRSKEETSQKPIVEPAIGAVPSKPSETYVLGGQISKHQRRNSRHFTLAEMRMLGVAPEETPTAAENGEETGNKSNLEVRQANLNPTNFASVPKRPVISSSKDILMEDPKEETPLKIFIPKEKWKKGVVYRVNNCFYADDGEFLYKI